MDLDDIRMISCYAAADQCKHPETYGMTCYRCGKCGRRFKGGMLAYIPEGQTVDGRPLTCGPVDVEQELEAQKQMAEAVAKMIKEKKREAERQ